MAQSAYNPGNVPTTTALINLIYPVGSIYQNASDGTNPATLLGVGTWSAMGTGRVLVGINGADADFTPVGKTGGSKTVTTGVTVSTQPTVAVSVQPTFTVNAHNHDIDSNNSSAQIVLSVPAQSIYEHKILGRPSFNSTTEADFGSSTVGPSFGASSTTGTTIEGTTVNASPGTTRTADVAVSRTVDTALSNAATSVVQPYEVVYIWKRVS